MIINPYIYGGASLLLDTYPSAAVAYSLRRLRTAYTGNAIRVRRSSDNTEQDFGFVNNVLDTQTMLDFVGYNIWTYSEDISQTIYTVTGSTKSPDVETAPDGTLTGDKVVENTSFSEHGLNRTSGTIVNATSYTTSAYFKQAERTKIKIYSNISGANQNCDLDLTNGSVSNSTFANTPVVTSEANGWYRFSVAITSGTTSATNGMTFRLFNASNAITYTGDGTSGVYVWGYQLSQTSSVKAYQKTVATAGGDGFVTAWYDQTGNGRNATNTTAANQPSIVASGVILVENSKPSLLFDGNTQRLGTLYTLTFPYSIFAIAKRLITGSSGLIGTQRIGNITAGGFVFFTEASVLKLRHPAAVDVTIADTANLFLGYAGRVSNTGYIGINNSALNSVSSLNATQYNQNVSIGGALTATSPFRLWNGYISEVIMYASDNSANRTGIETNINTYYSIY